MENETRLEESRAIVRDLVPQIEKLRPLKDPGIHYLAWKCRVTLMLKCAHLWEVVDPASRGASSAERKRDARDSIQAAVAFRIKGNPDPRDCWNYLQNRFAPNAPVRRLRFQQRLYSLKMQEGERVSDFETRVRVCLWHLRDMEVVIDEKELVSRLVFALPPSWRIVASHFQDILTQDELFKNMREVESWNEYRASRLEGAPVCYFPGGRFELQRRLHSLRVQEGETVLEFLIRVESLLARLREMEVDTEEQELNLILISALPRSGDVAASVLALQYDKLTKGELLQRMICLEAQGSHQETPGFWAPVTPGYRNSNRI